MVSGIVSGCETLVQSFFHGRGQVSVPHTEPISRPAGFTAYKFFQTNGIFDFVVKDHHPSASLKGANPAGKALGILVREDNGFLRGRLDTHFGGRGGCV